MLWTFMYAYGIAAVIVWGATASVLNYITVVLAVFFATRHIGITLVEDAIMFGIGWALMHALLDYIYITPAAGFEAMLLPSTWINYVVVLATPLAIVLYQDAARAHASIETTTSPNSTL